jgi:monofunctional chorismate mutase
MDEIALYRKQVDEIDEQILTALCQRVKICKAIGVAKKKKGLAVRDVAREEEVYKRVKQWAEDFHLSFQQVEKVYREIVNMCSAVQE